MYAATHDLLPVYFTNMFQVHSSIHTHSTIQKDKIHQLSHKLNLTQIYCVYCWPFIVECISERFKYITITW